MAWADHTASTEPLLIADKSVTSATKSGIALGSTSTRNSRHSANIAGSRDRFFAPLPKLTSTLRRVCGCSSAGSLIAASALAPEWPPLAAAGTGAARPGPFALGWTGGRDAGRQDARL